MVVIEEVVQWFIIMPYLGALTVLAVEESLESDAIAFVLAIQRRKFAGIGAGVGRSDVFAKPVLAQEQIVQMGAPLVFLTIPGLSLGHTTVHFQITKERLRVFSAVSVVSTLLKESRLQRITLRVVVTLLGLNQFTI